MATVNTGGINWATLRSLPFIILVLGNVGMWLASTGQTYSGRDAVIFSAVSAAAYALARGLAKINSDGRPFWQTTEFYVALIGAAIALVGGLHGTISGRLSTELLVMLAALAKIADGLRVPTVQALDHDHRAGRG